MGDCNCVLATDSSGRGAYRSCFCMPANCRLRLAVKREAIELPPNMRPGLPNRLREAGR